MVSLPRGILNANPFNLEFNSAINWQGQIVTSDGSPYLRFQTAVLGLRAGMKDAHTKVYAHKLNTLAKLIPVFAPSSENDVTAYIADVAQRLGIAPDTPLAINDPDSLIAYAKAIVVHEQGHCPTGPDWYRDETYNRAAEMALAYQPAT